MTHQPPARLGDRPFHSRSFSSASLQSKPLPQDSFDSLKASKEASHDGKDSSSDRRTQQSEQEYVKWGIAWHPPTLMAVYLFGGIGVAIGHHFYFASLHGTLAGSSTRQQWSTAIGTAASFLVVTLLRAASCIAYSQYVWILVRRKAYRLSTLDKLFALTTDPTGFFGWEMLKHAKVGMLLAFFTWITPLAGIAPPSTLSVVPGLITETRQTSMGSIDWNSPLFYDVQTFFSLPSSKVQAIATQSALSMGILPMTPPLANSSFSMQFYGPAVQCAPPSSAQQKILDYYKTSARVKPGFVTKGSIQDDLKNTTQFSGQFGREITSFNTLVFSAFAPYAGVQGWLYGLKGDSIDPFNNWDVDLPWEMKELGGLVDEHIIDDVVQQMFVQTSTSGFFCRLGNASYNVDFEFVNGAQTAVNYTTSQFAPVLSMRSGGGGGGSAMRDDILPGPYNQTVHTRFELSYMAVWQSFASLVSGNISMGYTNLERPSDNSEDTNLTLIETNSRILLNGLSACDEITNNFWQDLPPTLENPDASPVDFFNPSKRPKANDTNAFFEKPAWMCRNRTLPRALEDLAGNITIGMLSSANLTSPNSTLINVTSGKTHNIYQYDNLNLIISYTAAVVLTILCFGLGVFSFLDNGVAHSNAFSAMIATTRNPDLDNLSRGHSLGAEPLDEGVAGVKLRFGELVRGGGRSLAFRTGHGERRIGFGFEGDVSGLHTGERYT